MLIRHFYHCISKMSVCIRVMWWRLAIVVGLTYIVLWAWWQRRAERFIDAYNADYPATDDGALAPWLRHPVWMGADSDPRDDFPNAYYHTEYDDDYERALCEALSCAKDADEPWAPEVLLAGDTAYADNAIVEEDDLEKPPADPAPPPFVQDAFAAAAKAFRRTIAPPSQLLHERWTSYRVSPNSERAKVVLEFVVYRPPAHHAKHVVATATVSPGPMRAARFVDVRVVGAMFQDTFALPVVAAGQLPALSPYAVISTPK